MSGRRIRVVVEVEIPEGADAYQVEDLIYQAAQGAQRRALAEAGAERERPGQCPRCGKGGQSESAR